MPAPSVPLRADPRPQRGLIALVDQIAVLLEPELVAREDRALDLADARRRAREDHRRADLAHAAKPRLVDVRAVADPAVGVTQLEQEVRVRESDDARRVDHQ